MDQECKCLVSVLVTTYNHEKYIAQCLDGMVSQKTDFPFEIIVRDDCSTDGTGDIIRAYAEKYPGLVIPFILEFNHFSRGLTNESFAKMFAMARGKYIAICEGDDFWTDPEKLQIQTDWLESHPDCSMCVTASHYANPDGTLRTDKVFRTDTVSRDLTIEEILGGWKAATNTVVYRKACLEEDVIIPFLGTCVNEDYARMVYMALKGKVHYIDRLTGAYRVGNPGSFSDDTHKRPEVYKARVVEFANMMDRMDAYTEGKYTELIRKVRDRQLFDMYANLGDRENMKKYLHAYDDASPVWRTLEKIRTVIPGPMNRVKDMIRGIRK